MWAASADREPWAAHQAARTVHPLLRPQEPHHHHGGGGSSSSSSGRSVFGREGMAAARRGSGGVRLRVDSSLTPVGGIAKDGAGASKGVRGAGGTAGRRLGREAEQAESIMLSSLDVEQQGLRWWLSMVWRMCWLGDTQEMLGVELVVSAPMVPYFPVACIETVLLLLLSHLAAHLLRRIGIAVPGPFLGAAAGALTFATVGVLARAAFVRSPIAMYYWMTVAHRIVGVAAPLTGWTAALGLLTGLCIAFRFRPRDSMGIVRDGS